MKGKPRLKKLSPLPDAPAARTRLVHNHWSDQTPSTKDKPMSKHEPQKGKSMPKPIFIPSRKQLQVPDPDRDVFETYGAQSKRDLRAERRAARQAFNASIRATRADRDADRPPPPLPPLLLPLLRHWRSQSYRAASANGEDADHA